VLSKFGEGPGKRGNEDPPKGRILSVNILHNHNGRSNSGLVFCSMCVTGLNDHTYETLSFVSWTFIVCKCLKQLQSPSPSPLPAQP